MGNKFLFSFVTVPNLNYRSPQRPYYIIYKKNILMVKDSRHRGKITNVFSEVLLQFVSPIVTVGIIGDYNWHCKLLLLNKSRNYCDWCFNKKCYWNKCFYFKRHKLYKSIRTTVFDFDLCRLFTTINSISLFVRLIFISVFLFECYFPLLFYSLTGITILPVTTTPRPTFPPHPGNPHGKWQR